MPTVMSNALSALWGERVGVRWAVASRARILRPHPPHPKSFSPSIGRRSRPDQPYAKGGEGLVLLLALLALSPAAAKPADPVVAQVGSETLTAGEFSRLIAGLDPGTRGKIASDRKALLQLMRAELGRQAILGLAHAQHWDRRPEIAARAERAAQDVIITSFLEAAATPPPSFPSDADVAKVYQENLTRFMLPRQYHLAQIYIARPAEAQKLAAARQRAGDLARAAGAPDADFAAIARHSSEDPDSAARGGDLGWVSEKLMIAEILHAVSGLGDGEVSPPVDCPDGWHIMRVIGTKPPAPESLASARPAIVQMLRQEAETQREQSYVDDLLSRGHAEADLDAIEALLPKPR